jgi:hypothetical protein
MTGTWADIGLCIIGIRIYNEEMNYWEMFALLLAFTNAYC